MADKPTRRAMAAGLAAAGLAAAAPARPKRIVSLGLCLDPVLMRLADRSQIAAISHLSRDPSQSVIVAEAATYPFTTGSAEEVLTLKPDLVLASRRSGLQTRTALKALGLRVETFSVPDTVVECLDQVRHIGRLIGYPERGEALVSEIERALARAAPAPGTPRLKALVYQAGGMTAGADTLISDMLTRCGFDNLGSRYGLKAWRNVPLERVLLEPPQLLLLADIDPNAPRWADRILLHPALERLEPKTHRIALPPRFIYCGGPVLMRSAALLARARRETLALQTRRR